LIDFSVLDRSLELKTLGDHFSILLLLLVVEVKVTLLLRIWEMIFQCWREEEREVKLNFRFLLEDCYVEEDSFSEVLLCSPPRVP
jgi:hypothetical protein